MLESSFTTAWDYSGYMLRNRCIQIESRVQVYSAARRLPVVYAAIFDRSSWFLQYGNQDKEEHDKGKLSARNI